MEENKDLYYILTIYFNRADMLGQRKIEKTSSKVFSTKEKAVDYLIENGFVYGAPYPFNYVDWYKYYDAVVRTKFLTADITEVELNDESFGEELSYYIGM